MDNFCDSKYFSLAARKVYRTLQIRLGEVPQISITYLLQKGARPHLLIESLVRIFWGVPTWLCCLQSRWHRISVNRQRRHAREQMDVPCHHSASPDPHRLPEAKQTCNNNITVVHKFNQNKEWPKAIEIIHMYSTFGTATVKIEGALAS